MAAGVALSQQQVTHFSEAVSKLQTRVDVMVRCCEIITVTDQSTIDGCLRVHIAAQTLLHSREIGSRFLQDLSHAYTTFSAFSERVSSPGDAALITSLSDCHARLVAVSERFRATCSPQVFDITCARKTARSKIQELGVALRRLEREEHDIAGELGIARLAPFPYNLAE